jgi:hypothetical protein
VSLFERFSVFPLLIDYRHTLVDANTGRPDRRAYLISYGVPVLLTAVTLWRGWTLPDMAVLLAGTSLLAAALTGLFFHLSTVRLQVENDPRLRGHRRVPHLVNNTAITVLYAAGVSILASVVIVVVDALPKTAPGWSITGGTLLTVFFSSHLVITMMTVLRLAWGVYVDLYDVRTPSVTGRR